MFPYHTQIIAPYATMPLLTEVPSSKRVTDRPTDMCNPTDAAASKNEKNCRMLEIIPYYILLYKIISFCIQC